MCVIQHASRTLFMHEIEKTRKSIHIQMVFFNDLIYISVTIPNYTSDCETIWCFI